MHHPWIVALAGAALWSFSTAGAGPLDMAAVTEASLARSPAKQSGGFDPALIKAQVLLDRAGYSPGEGVAAREPFTINPGPNNPVGVVWIALSAKGYGIHGTPEPSKVGKTMSHGCIRLTNWDAKKLAAMVDKGTVVDFRG
jgi:L,D-transpeptidase catalytic domain